MHPNPVEKKLRTSEPVGYIIIALVLLVIVAVVLEKAGLKPQPALWASYVTVTALTIATCLWMRSTRLVTFAAAGRKASHSMLGMAQIMAAVPCGLLIAYLAGAQSGFRPIALTMAATLLALWMSVFLFGVALNRSGAYCLPRLLEVRFGSGFVRLLAVVAAGAPVFCLICSQFLAFGLLAEELLGISAGKAIPLGAAIAILIVWLSGLTGGQIAAAIAIAMFVVTFAPVYWQFGLAERLPVLTANTSGPLFTQIAESASPLLVEAAANGSSRLDMAGFILAAAVALSVLPMFLQFHPAASKGRNTARIALAATMIALALGAVIVNAVPAGLLFAPGSGGGIVVALGELSVLFAIPVSAAILLFALGGMMAFDSYGEIGRGPGAENGRLIASRLSIGVIGIAAGWATAVWGRSVTDPVLFLLFLAPCIVFPAAVAAIWWSRCGPMAALAGMVAGGATYAALWALGVGLLDVSALVAETSPVLEFISTRTLAQASLLGAASGAAALVLFAFLPARANGQSETVFSAIHEERRVRLLNETAL